MAIDTTDLQLTSNLASFPGLPRFLFFGCVPYNTQKQKSGEKGESLETHHVNDIWCMRGGRGCGGGGGGGRLQTDRMSFLPVNSSTVNLVNVWGPGYHWSAR